MSEQDATKKIPTIRRSIPITEIEKRERERLIHFESQAEMLRDRLRRLGGAA